MNELDIGRSALLTDLSMCVNYYRLFSPGLYCCVRVPVELEDGVRVVPDLVAMVNHGRHKQCRPEPDYVRFHGPPNFVLDVFPPGELLDYEQRRSRFEQAGVIEYVAVLDEEPLNWIWNRRRDGRFEVIESDHEDMIGSAALPGLWIPTKALRARDWWTIMGCFARGVTRRKHHDFMDAIWRADEQP